MTEEALAMSKGRNPGREAIMLRDYDCGNSSNPTPVTKDQRVWLSGEVDEHFWIAYGMDANGRFSRYLGLIPEDALNFLEQPN